MADIIVGGFNLTTGRPAKAQSGDDLVDQSGNSLTAFTPAYYFGLASGTASGDSANTLYGTNVLSSNISQNSVSGAFTVTEAGLYVVSSQDETFGGGFFAQAVYAPAGVSRVLMFRGRADPASAGGWHYSVRGILSLAASGTFELRPVGKHPPNSVDGPIAIFRVA